MYTGKRDDAVALLQKHVDDELTPAFVRQFVEDLTAEGSQLFWARQYADRALNRAQQATTDASLDHFAPEDQLPVWMLAQLWDAIGWIEYKQNRVEQASAFVSAAWDLIRDPQAASHLKEIRAKQGKSTAVPTMFKPGENPTGQKLASSLAFAEEDMRARSVGVPSLPVQTSSAEFLILFQSGAPIAVKFLSGEQSLRSAEQLLLKAPIKQPTPDDGPEKILCQGVLSCSKYTNPSCQFTLFPLSTELVARQHAMPE